jgi:hypothetical protein
MAVEAGIGATLMVGGAIWSFASYGAEVARSVLAQHAPETFTTILQALLGCDTPRAPGVAVVGYTLMVDAANRLTTEQ